MENVFVLIMAGGAGTRFWPYSREEKPKQFLDILGTGQSLLQMTFKRFEKVCPAERIFIATNEKYKYIVKEQLPSISDNQVILEPERRNTAPCIAYSSYKIAEIDEDKILIVAPSDHAIFNEEYFYQTLENAVEGAQKNEYLVTIGIKPSRPDTGYGYIRFEDQNNALNKVINFTEKPDKHTAEDFIQSGDYLWNAGIFVWGLKSIIRSFEQYLPEMARIFNTLKPYYNSEKEQAEVNKVYGDCENISVDYGIMEKAENVFVVQGNFGWSDLGSWNSLHDLKDKDSDNNVLEGNVLIYDTESCFIRGSREKLIVVEGLQNYLVTEHKNAILICKKDSEKRLRQFVQDIRDKKGPEFL